jgi:hypothetical protein
MEFVVVACDFVDEWVDRLVCSYMSQIPANESQLGPVLVNPLVFLKVAFLPDDLKQSERIYVRLL